MAEETDGTRLVGLLLEHLGLLLAIPPERRKEKKKKKKKNKFEE